MDLNNMSVQELKALWYDQFVVKAQAEHDINIIAQAIAAKQREEEADGDD